MAKIRSCRKTWSQAKIQLCWWHHIMLSMHEGSSGSSMQGSTHLVKQTQKRVRGAYYSFNYSILHSIVHR
ncbi:hypothetical protein L208DRAFT_1385101 [Tricholoma matsutake]|nr:hypothetical protein L208DRAFT_1385101 [Tricholoma matsutake 945]